MITSVFAQSTLYFNSIKFQPIQQNIVGVNEWSDVIGTHFTLFNELHWIKNTNPNKAIIRAQLLQQKHHCYLFYQFLVIVQPRRILNKSLTKLGRYILNCFLWDILWGFVRNSHLEYILNMLKHSVRIAGYWLKYTETACQNLKHFHF